MTITRQITYVSILILSSCVDRISYPVTAPQDLPVAVYGFISNRPGPYQVNINSSVDTESSASPRVPVSARQVTLIDDLGNNEMLREISPGIYQTSPAGIQGRIGGVYKLRIELINGNVFESAPDTLISAGIIDTLYHDFNKRVDFSGQPSYGFDLKVDSRGNAEKVTRYMWNFTGTFKAITHPESIRPGFSKCYPLYDEGIICNFLPPCSGYRNVGTPGNAIYEKKFDCTCCTCWYNLFNNAPVLSDELFAVGGDYKAVDVYRVPLNEWIFMFKIRTEVTQFSLTEKTFRFFKSIRDQKVALGSLFQPITGKIPNTFIQIEGKTASMNGIFYATGVSSKSAYLTGNDVGKNVPVPTVDFTTGVGGISCLELFPNPTTVKPDFWTD